MHTDLNLTEQMVRLLQDIIIAGAEFIYERQMKSAGVWEATYPYSGPILDFERVSQTLVMAQATDIGTDLHADDWGPIEFSKISESLREFSGWQSRLGEDQEENLYLVRKHLRRLAMQVLNHVSASYGFQVPK
jgi:hypothetical protein